MQTLLTFKEKVKGIDAILTTIFSACEIKTRRERVDFSLKSLLKEKGLNAGYSSIIFNVLKEYEIITYVKKYNGVDFKLKVPLIEALKIKSLLISEIVRKRNSCHVQTNKKADECFNLLPEGVFPLSKIKPLIIKKLNFTESDYQSAIRKLLKEGFLKKINYNTYVKTTKQLTAINANSSGEMISEMQFNAPMKPIVEKDNIDIIFDEITSPFDEEIFFDENDLS